MDPTTVVDLTPLTTPLADVFVAALTAGGAWLVAMVGKWIRDARVEKRSHGILREKQLMKWLDWGIDAGIGYAEEQARQLALDRGKVEVRNRMVLTAAREAVRLLPKTLDELGYDEKQVQRLVKSFLVTPSNNPVDPLPESDAALPDTSLGEAP